MSHQLTAGICKRLFEADEPDDNLLELRPTVQFLSYKKVATGGAGSNVDRYRIIVSDGEHFLQSMLSTQLNYLIEENHIAKHTIAIIDKFTCNMVQGKRLLIVLGLTVVAKVSDKIGEPTALQAPPGARSAAHSASPAPDGPVSAPSASSGPTPAPGPQSSIQRQASKGGRNSAIFPIESLSPYMNNWTIRALVTQKSDIRTWSNAKGEGKLFSVVFVDDTGEIKATAFNKAVEDLYEKFQDGKVYYISKARVNLAKKKFTNVTNEYELTLERNTEVQECHDVVNAPTIKYKFVDIVELGNLEKDATCDVLAIVKEAGPLGEITTRSSNKTIMKRELTLVDRSGYTVRLTLWGAQAEQWSAEDQPVVAFKGVKVGDFQGRSLSMAMSSTMQINPDISEAHVLRGWYDAGGAEQSYQSHTNASSGGSGLAFKREEICPLEEVRELGYGEPDKPDVFSSRATVMHIKPDNLTYPACPTTGCHKKVVEVTDGWRCEKCSVTHEKPQHRYIVSAAVADWSGQLWFQGFHDAGQVIFGMTADELVEIRENNDSQYQNVLERAVGSTYNFVCRAKQDSYNDNIRTRYGISRIEPLNYAEEGKYIANLLRSEWAQ
ncbi:replication factor-a protein [Obba rivulosa]|uniref:Replication protein A subunit n=1 Tax=Obba rivulosa TaxID=1052685 RepID=A0A8E2DN58_9APHY|nr:replication factor-a protein [Obba rivulosa]